MIRSGRPFAPRVEHGADPLGVGTGSPRLSWCVPEAHDAYEIDATTSGSGPQRLIITSTDSILVPWPWAALASRERVSWRVRTRSGDRWSDWSDDCHFEVGLLQPSDWQAAMITHPSSDRPARGERGAVHFRRRFTLDRPAALARLRATAFGIYELHLDGHRVGDRELAPGWTAYRHVLEYQSYDVTSLLTAGDHELVATVTDGWYRGSIGFTREECVYGDRLGFLAQLEFTTDRGVELVATDPAWEVTDSSPITAADLIEGQRIDLRMTFPPVTSWTPAVKHPSSVPTLGSSPMPPTRRIETFAPRSIARLDTETQVIDFGLNLNGWIEIDTGVLGPSGNIVTLTHAEVLDEAGDVMTSTLDAFDFVTGTPLGAGQVDQVTSAGTAGTAVEFRHTSHGFRYARITGADDLTEDDLRAVMVHTDLIRTGWFQCSDDRINALHDAAVLSLRGNVCDIPTDCPHRERTGWTGDWQVFFPTAAFLYDVAGFTDRWLRDLALDQWGDGRVPNHVPDPIGPAGWDHPMAAFVTGSAGWGDAATIVPFDMAQAYGDVEALRRQYRSMQRWVEFALRSAASGRHPSRIEADPVEAPHERYLWDTGFHWGEWAMPGETEDVFSGSLDQSHVASAFLYRSLMILAETARILGDDADAHRFADLADAVRSAWRTEFVDADGTVRPHTQPTLVRALAFGLVADEHRAKVAADLVSLVEANGDHLATGFLATPFLLPVLAETGHADVAYRLLFQGTQPSWLAMIDAGATTIWENWDGVASGGGSLNHYSKGAVVSFLHRHVAGIRPINGEPAYRRFSIEPIPGAGITSAEAILDSPYGRIRSGWELRDGVFRLEVEVPVGTTAHVGMPSGITHELSPGSHELDEAWS